MTRWMRFVGTTINGTPILLVTLLIMIAAWSAAAEIYATAIQIPGHGEFAALVLVGLNVLCSWLLVFNLAGLAHDLQELRLPQHRQLLSVGLVFILGFIFVLPCALVWSLSGSARDVFMIAMGSVAGTAGAVLWRIRPRMNSAPAARISASAMMPSVPRQLPKPWQAVRVALGPPFAPASWKTRGLQLAILCAAVAGAPILVLLYRSSLQPRAFPYVLHAMQFTGFLAAIGLCWIWPLSRLLAIFNPQKGALSELALLPGLGAGRQQLRRLCLVALSVPTGGLILLLIGALVLVKLQHLPHGSYLKLALEFLLIPLITLPILVAQIAKPSMPAAWSVTVLMFSQLWAPSILIWSDLWDAPDSVMVHRIRALIIGIGLAALIVIIGFSIYSLRKLLNRPHPFVEVSS
jgi:hypothetical protein